MFIGSGEGAHSSNSNSNSDKVPAAHARTHARTQAPYKIPHALLPAVLAHVSVYDDQGWPPSYRPSKQLIISGDEARQGARRT